jgi:DNA-binding response OmpR family regulator
MEGLARPVLVLDRDIGVFLELRRRLARYGFTPLLAHSGIGIKDAVKEIRPAIIVMDITLPDADGVKAIRDIKDDYSLKDIPLFVASNYPGRLDRRTGPRVEGVYSKPLNYDHFVAHVVGAHMRRVGRVDTNTGRPIK